MSNETTSIPLNKLIAWDGNVRKSGVTDGIDELAASIAAHGLLQSIVVRPAKRGKYEVVAGQRRLLALQKLVADKTIAKSADVPCMIANGDCDASELSLAENVVRMPMHPADQFEAFRDLIDGGATVADVAARFGVSETLVLKRLKLGRVSPVIMDAYRTGDIGLDLVQAFTISGDHEAQERVWNESPAWNLNPRAIKSALTEDEIPASDKRVKLVGLDAYEAAGGAIRRDLFDPEDGGYLLDSELLDNLVTRALEDAADQVRAEGWQWVQIVPELDYEFLSGFQRRYPEDVPLTGEQESELAALAAEYDDLVDTDDEAEVKRLTEIEARMDEIEATSERWPDETLAIAGAVVSVGYHGDIRVERGLVRPEDVPADDTDTDTPSDEGADEPAIKLSARLIEDLTAQKSAAISAELARRPDVALAAVVHALALDVFYTYTREGSSLHLMAPVTPLRNSLYEPESCKGFTALETERESWGDHLPGDPANLWAWCLDQPQDVLLDLLAVIAALSVDAVVPKNGRPRPHADKIARAVSLDMAVYFTPTADNFFGRISRPGILATIDEAKGGHGPALDKMKKAELAARAADIVAGTGWLPEPLRIADAGDAADSEAEVIEDDAVPEAAE
ncbi:MAG: ParB/RepB/Spo0J family partition protein [Propylenella sp.]